MCGIIGYKGKKQASPILLNGLLRLQYRGYDSVGLATMDNNIFFIKKDIGHVEEVNKKLNFKDLPGKIGIAHTRWATCGDVTKENAHPFISHNEKVVAVHNGIIENYETLKKQLQNEGYNFVSETDSEVIAHYIEQQLHVGKSVPESIRAFMEEAQGTFAILLMVQGEEEIYAMRRDSPLVLGINNNEFYIASDIYAFSNLANQAIFFENDEYAIIGKDYSFFSRDGTPVAKQAKKFFWEEKNESKQTFDHFMLKEIMEEPQVVRRLLLSLNGEQKETFEKLIKYMKASRKIVFVSSGTSYHASLLGVYYLHKCGIDAQALIASEFEHFAVIDENSLVIALSQSGETMDVIDALKYAKSHKAKIASIVNVPYSTIQRMYEISLNILAGQEVCVAATKSFVNQVVVLLNIAKQFGFHINLEELPVKIGRTFDKIVDIRKLAKEIAKNKDLYILGRGLSYPVAREIALKIKEISYIHAEGMMGGELKHGTIALIEHGTPVICLVSNSDHSMLSNAKEVEARGARVITIGTHSGDIVINTDHDGTFGILATIAGQLLTYYIAKEKDLPIDRPRNLAKSVTVR